MIYVNLTLKFPLFQRQSREHLENIGNLNEALPIKREALEWTNLNVISELPAMKGDILEGLSSVFQ